MPHLVVHIRKEGADHPQPAYAIWVSDTTASVRAFAPEWEEAASKVEEMLKSRAVSHGRGKVASAGALASALEEEP